MPVRPTHVQRRGAECFSTDPTSHRSMHDINAIARYCDELLDVASVTDYCPNGLQVAGQRPVARIVSGVSACLALIQAAAADGADAIVVHHGWFWKGDDPRLIGMHGRRVAAVMASGLSLLAYHLPLDLHPELGNNRELARVLGIDQPRPATADGLVWRGQLATPLRGSALAEHVAKRLGRAPLHVSVQDRDIRQVAWCTGAAQRFIDRAAALDVDLYLSGEVSEQTVHMARELGIDYMAAGHHATERYGVQALGERLAERFGLSHRFIDIDNPA
jgi:dinuclear metal center YbgI/SA1388 family protein